MMSTDGYTITKKVWPANRFSCIIPSLTLLKIKNAHKERGCALCEHFLFGFNVCYIFFTVILIFLSSLSLLA